MAAISKENGGSPGYQLKTYRNRSFGLILLLVSNSSLHHHQLAAASHHHFNGMFQTNFNGMIQTSGYQNGNG